MTRRAAPALAALLLLGPPLAAETVGLELAAASESDAAGTATLRVESRVVFMLDTVAQQLTSSGIWTAQRTLGPDRRVRYTHKFEDLRVEAGGELALRSYECVEGTLGGELLSASACGNYRFGANGLDEGGAGDDEVVGPPRSLVDYAVTGFEWDGERLVVTLGAPDVAGDPDAPGRRLQLTFRRPILPSP